MLKLESVTFTRLNRRLVKINLQSMVSCNRVWDDSFPRDDRFFSINSFSVEKKKKKVIRSVRFLTSPIYFSYLAPSDGNLF